MEKYRLYFAQDCGSYKLIAEHQNLNFINQLAQTLNHGKYMVVKKSPLGDDVIDFKFVGKSCPLKDNDNYDLADRPKIKRRIKYIKENENGNSKYKNRRH